MNHQHTRAETQTHMQKLTHTCRPNRHSHKYTNAKAPSYIESLFSSLDINMLTVSDTSV